MPTYSQANELAQDRLDIDNRRPPRLWKVLCGLLRSRFRRLLEAEHEE